MTALQFASCHDWFCSLVAEVKPMYDISVNDLPGKLLEIVQRVIQESASRCSQHSQFIEAHKRKVEDATATGCAFYLVFARLQLAHLYIVLAILKNSLFTECTSLSDSRYELVLTIQFCLWNVVRITGMYKIVLYCNVLFCRPET